MKNILITGEGSFIGISVQRYLDLFPDKYCVMTIGTKNEECLIIIIARLVPLSISLKKGSYISQIH